MGGDIIYDFCDKDDNPYDMMWDQHFPGGIRGRAAYRLSEDGNDVEEIQGGFLAPLVNEPDVRGQKANCCFSSNYGGLYLVVCQDLAVGVELLVHYGLNYHSKEEQPEYPPPPLSQDLTVEEKNRVLAMLRLPLVEWPPGYEPPSQQEENVTPSPVPKRHRSGAQETIEGALYSPVKMSPFKCNGTAVCMCKNCYG
jgi:hypothetical protein